MISSRLPGRIGSALQSQRWIRSEKVGATLGGVRQRTSTAVVIGLGMVLTLVLAGCNSAMHPTVSVIGSTPTPKPQPPTPVVTAASTAGWMVYRDSSFPFEVPAPPGWRASVFYDTDHAGITGPCAYTVYFFHTEIPMKAELMIETRVPESIFVGVSLNCPRFNPSANHWLAAESSPISFGGQPSTLYDNDGEGQVHRVTVAEFGGCQWQFTYLSHTSDNYAHLALYLAMVQGFHYLG